MADMDMDMKDVGQRIRHFRRTLDLTQRQLAHLLGVAPGTLANWELGTARIGEHSARKMANFFGVSVEWLLTGQVPAVTPLASVWPADQMRERWGVSAELPSDWPEGLRRFVSFAIQFGLDMSESAFRAMVDAARTLGTDAPLPLALAPADGGDEEEAVGDSFYLRHLLAQVTPANRHAETETGAPRGREVW